MQFRRDRRTTPHGDRDALWIRNLRIWRDPRADTRATGGEHDVLYCAHIAGTVLPSGDPQPVAIEWYTQAFDRAA